MKASYQLLISGALLISVAVLCHGAAVLDADGNEVQANSLYTIKNAAMDFHGGLAALHKSNCKNYVYETPEGNPGFPVSFSASSSEPVLQLGHRYRFSFLMGAPRICDTFWSVGDSETIGSISFKPITAGDFFYLNNYRWFEIRSTEQTGVYKLAACSCEFCKVDCPELGSFVVNGTTVVLGIGGSHFTVRFQKYAALAMKTAAQ